MISEEVSKTRKHVARMGGLLFERQLTDAAGGNISVRVGDLICMSPSYSGSHRQWQLEPEQVLVVDKTGKILEGEGKVSRESNVHLKLHQRFREAGTAVIHAHPRNLLVFAALERPMPPVLEANLKFGEVVCVRYAPAHSEELADNVVNGLAGQEVRIRNHAAGVIAPWHGLFLMGKDMNAAFDAVERFDTNAKIILAAQGAGLASVLEQKRAALQNEVAASGKVH